MISAIAFVVMFVIGLAVIPVWISVLATPFGKNVLGKGMFILGQLAHGGTMAYYRGDGTVDMMPFDRERNAVYRNGVWLELGDEQPTTYRLGWADFLVDCNATDTAPTNTLVEQDSLRAPTDGGIALLDEWRGGYRLFSDADPSEPVIHYPRYLQQMERQGNELINRAKEVALEKYGGDEQTSQTTWGLLLLGGFITMFALSFVMLLVM